MKNFKKANLGISFESLIEYSNDIFFKQNIAAIMKVPTAVKILRRYDPIKKRSDIVSCFPEKKGSVDFLGQYGADPVAFEAKSTENKTSFPLANIADHQLKWLQAVDRLGGFAFILFEIKQAGAIYRMTYKQLAAFMQQQKRKSIPFDFFEKNCFRASFSPNGVLEYFKDLKKGE